MNFIYKIALVFLASLIFQMSVCNAFAGSAAMQKGGLGPLAGRNQSPLLNLFYITSATNAKTLGKGESEFRVHLDISNIHERHIMGSSTLLYDMEIYRTALNYSFGILPKLDLHVEIPTIAFEGGRLDGSIQDYHDLFGFPNAGRENTANGIYDYSYVNNGDVVFDFASHGQELSDINVDLKWSLMDESSKKTAIAARAGIKLPTGKYESASGSGEMDYNIGLLVSKSNSPFHLYAGIDHTFIKVPSELKSLINEDITHYFVGVEYEFINNSISFILQVDGLNTPFVKTEHDSFNNEILEIVSGVKGAHNNEKLLWQVSLREDLIHYSTVDFTLSFSLGSRF